MLLRANKNDSGKMSEMDILCFNLTGMDLEKFKERRTGRNLGQGSTMVKLWRKGDTSLLFCYRTNEYTLSYTMKGGR